MRRGASLAGTVDFSGEKSKNASGGIITSSLLASMVMLAPGVFVPV